MLALVSAISLAQASLWQPPNLTGKGWATLFEAAYRDYDAKFLQKLPPEMRPANAPQARCWWAQWLAGLLVELAEQRFQAGAGWQADLSQAVDHAQKFVQGNCDDSDKWGSGGELDAATHYVRANSGLPEQD